MAFLEFENHFTQNDARLKIRRSPANVKIACNRRWEIAELALRPCGWSQARRFIVARRRIEAPEPKPTLFNLDRYLYRAWVTNLPLSPQAVWHFYDGRAGMKPRIY